MTRGMYVHPWDLEEEGFAAVLPFLRNMGIDVMSLAFSCNAGKFFRPHGGPAVRLDAAGDSGLSFYHHEHMRRRSFGWIAAALS